MPRYVYRGGRGVRATTVLRLARPTERGCTCAPALLSYDGRARGTEITHFNPLSICSGSARFSRYASRTPSPEPSGGRGVRAIYQRRLARPTVGVVPALLLFYRMTAGPGNGNHTSQPLDMLRSRPFFPICITRSSTGGFLRQGRYMTARTFCLPLILTNTFNIFPRTGQCAFPWTVQVMGNSGQSAFPVRFFCCTVSDGPGCPPFGGMHGYRRNGQGLRRP